VNPRNTAIQGYIKKAASLALSTWEYPKILMTCPKVKIIKRTRNVNRADFWGCLKIRRKIPQRSTPTVRETIRGRKTT
jgi:hypothetical protein